MYQSSQKFCILSQLQQIRSQSLNEYFTSNLSSFVNKEVVTDILNRFLTQHEDQFLNNITDTIIQVKNQCRKIKQELKSKEEDENLLVLKIQQSISRKYQNQMELYLKKWLEVEQLSFQLINQKNPIKAIKKFQDKIQQLNQQLINYKQYQQQLNQAQLLNYKKIINELQNQLNYKMNEISKLNANLKQHQYQNIKLNEKISLFEKLTHQFEQKFRQKDKLIEENHKKIAEVQRDNLEYLSRLQNSQKIQNDMNKKSQLMKFLQTKVSQFKQNNTKLKYEVQLILKDKILIEKQNQSLKKNLILLQSEQTRKCHLITQKENQFKQQSQKYRRLEEENYKQKIQFTKLESHMQIAELKIYEQDKKYKQLQAQHNKQKNLFSQQKSLLMETKSKKSLEIQKLTKLLEERNIKIGQIQGKLFEKQTILKQYIGTKDNQILQIQQELYLLRNQLSSREITQQKQYEAYLEQIVELKQKVKKLSPSSYQQTIEYDFRGKNIKIVNKRSRLCFMLLKLKQQVKILAEEKQGWQKHIREQMQIMKIDMKAMIGLIGKKMIEIKLKCDYCQHHEIANYVKIVSGPSMNSLNHHTNKFLNNKTEILYNNFGKILKSQPSKLTSPNIQIDKESCYNDNDSTLASSSKMSRNIKKLNQKMLILNQENSSYQIHLNRILQPSNKRQIQ